MADTYVVRYGRMRFLGEFTGLPDHDHTRGEQVVVRSDRGTELGEVLCPVSERTARFMSNPAQGEILRLGTHEDRDQEARLAADREPVFATCQELIAKRRLQMNLVDLEMIQGRERVVFYYLAEKRVDFRELVKDLARVLRTRIEMRQIGVRDEAKLLADYGDCGKPVCCNTHLSRMPPVSMKMAKIQKTTLDPAKISGRCGRLKCCLRYEYDTYRAMERSLPAVGSRVVTAKGRGRVVAQEILAEKLVVEFDDHRRIIVGRDDILSVEPPKGRLAAQAEDDEADDGPAGAIRARRRSLRRSTVRGRRPRTGVARARRSSIWLELVAYQRRTVGLMSFRDELAQIIARDPRYSIDAYVFILEALNLARQLCLKGKGPDHDRERGSRPVPRTAHFLAAIQEAAGPGARHRSRAVRGYPKTGPAPVWVTGVDRPL